MENKRKHLEFIQLVITRMNVNSFLIKGWNITIVAALFALSAKDADRGFVLLSIFPTIIFWGLDTYFLKQERLFRHLYDRVRCQQETEIDYSMNTNDFINEEDTQILNVFSSTTLKYFYLSILTVIIIMLLVCKSLRF